MGWTREKPTTPGWYWMMLPDYGEEVVCVHVLNQEHYAHRGHLVVEIPFSDALCSTADYEWWMGPIEVPQPPLAYSGVRG